MDNRYDPRTYLDYLKLKDVNTKSFLMFSELIDNSISSFDRQFGEIWKETLVIDFNINITEIKKNIHNLTICEGSSITVVDNGFGMNKNSLIEAMKLNRNPDDVGIFEKNKSKMNVHGRGLKQSAFFFGMDLIVSTTNLNKETWIAKLEGSKQETLNNPIFIDPIKDERELARGTTIFLNNIYFDKKFRYSTLKNICRALGYRYIKFFEKNKLEIKFNFIGEDPIYLNKSYVSEPENCEPMTTIEREWEDHVLNENSIDGFIDETISEIEKQRYSGKNIDQIVVDETVKKITDVFKSNKNRVNYFKFDMKFKIITSELDITFWMLPTKNASYRGIRLFEGERAIKHAGYSEGESKPYMGWFGKPESGNTEDRFAGSCDLSQLNLFSKTDKSSFTIPENIGDILNKKIFSVWFVFNQFVKKARKFVKNELPTATKQKDVSDFSDIFKTKFPNKNIRLIDSRIVDGVPTTSIEWRSEKKDGAVWIIEIRKLDELRSPKIYNINKNQDEPKIVIDVYSSHIFFRTMDKNNLNFYQEILIPFAMILSMQWIEFFEKGNNEIKTQEMVDSLNTGGHLFDE